jgi:hypothetical protein
LGPDGDKGLQRGMIGRVLTAAMVMLLAASASGPLQAEPTMVLAATSLGRDVSATPPEKGPGQLVPEAPVTTPGWLRHATPAAADDKAGVLLEQSTLVLLRTEAGEDGKIMGKLFLVLVRYTIEDVAVVAAAPEYCALPECAELPPDTVAEIADRARLSIERQLESGGRGLSSGTDIRAKDPGVVDPGPNPGPNYEPVSIMNPPLPWWKDWVTPTTVLGLIGAMIAGFGTWFGVQHQRHQMQMEQFRLAAAASAPAAPLVQSSVAQVPPKPTRSRARSGPSATPPAGTRRSRSRA